MDAGSIIALVISSVSLLVSILSYRRRSAKIKVDSSIGYLTGKDYEDKNTYLFFNAVNVREVSTTLNSLFIDIIKSFKLRNKKLNQIPFPATFQKFPLSLNYGERFSSWSKVEQILQAADGVGYKSGTVYVRCIYRDTLNKKYRSNWVKFNIDEYKNKISAPSLR